MGRWRSSALFPKINSCEPFWVCPKRGRPSVRLCRRCAAFDDRRLHEIQLRVLGLQVSVPLSQDAALVRDVLTPVSAVQLVGDIHPGDDLPERCEPLRIQVAVVLVVDEAVSYTHL